MIKDDRLPVPAAHIATIQEQAAETGRLKAELEAVRSQPYLSADMPDTAKTPWWRRWFWGG